jgi:ligand-binding sensor domain-containing protein
MMKRLAFLMIALICLSSAFSTDISKIKFEYLTVDDGLSQGIVEDILQDRQGFMWFATHDGLNRYDGIQFTVFRNERDDPQSLAANWIISLAEDKTGNIWIGSQGLNQYDPVMNRMTRIPVNADDQNAYQGGRVDNITVDFDSTIWFSTINGLAHYFPKQNRFKTYKHDPNNPKSIGTTNVSSTFLTRDNRLFVSTNSDPIYEYDRKTDSFKEISYKLAYQGKNSGKYIQEDLQGSLYIIAEFSGVHILNLATGEIKFMDKKVGGLNTENIRTRVLRVGPDEMWIGTDGGGINIYNPLTETMQYLMADTKSNNSLSGNAILCIYQDRDMNIWVGHYGSGISVWKRNKEKFVSYSHNPLNPASINKEIVSAIYEDSRGRIWIGQDGGGLSLFNEAEKSFEHIRYRAGVPGSLTSDVILAIHEDPSGNLLLGTYAGGLMVYDPDAGRVIKAFNSSNGMASDHVYTIFKDSKGRYWFSDNRSGFSFYDPVNYTFENIGPSSEGISSCSNQVLDIVEDPAGKIWIGTENAGFCIIDYDKKETKSYRFDINNKNSLSYNDVKSIVFIDNYAWIATNGGGLNRMDTKTDSFKVFTLAEGLSSNALMGLLKDTNNNLWISSTRGLMKFNTKTGEVEIFDKSQGIQGSEFKFNSQIVLRDGRMMFGGVNGLTVFHPDSIKNSTIIPKVAFTDFKIFDKSVIPGIKGSPLSKSINFTSFIKLNHKQSVFTIEFASLDYNAPAKNRYMYKLEGFDDNWNNAGNRRSVTYTNLDAGKYTFLIKGSNSDGVWNNVARKIVLRIRPPWYMTKFAIVIFLLAIILLIVYYIKQREKQSVHDKLILEQKIQEAQAELKGKAHKLEEQQEEIRRRDEAEKDIRFFSDGIALLSDIIAKKRRDLEDLATAIISELVRYINAKAGGIFVMDDSDPQHIVLRAAGEFCLSSDKGINQMFEVGEGNIGTCYVEKQTLKMDNIPDGYVVLRSGLGSISLHHAIYVPIIQDKSCVGVIEIASTGKLPDHKVTFVEKIAESLASIIMITKANEKTNNMLEQNNAQAEELRAQEEEMRQNLEELMATQEESQRKEKEILAELVSKTTMVKKLQEELAKLKKK